MSREVEVPLALRGESNGSMAVFEEGTVPFPVRRAFVIYAGEGETRGDHAHRTCSQMLVVLQGSVQVLVAHGDETNSIVLTQLSSGLLLPPMTWATQNYLTHDSMLLVVCDQLFDESDYIRNREEYEFAIKGKL